MQHAILSENQASPPACRLLLWQPEELRQVREIVVRAKCGRSSRCAAASPPAASGTPAGNVALGASRPQSPPSICHAGRAHRRDRYIALLEGSMVRARLGRLAANVLMVAMLVLAAATGAEAQEAADVDALELRASQAFEAGQPAEALGIAEKWAAAAQNIETAKGDAGPLTAGALGSVAWYALFAKQPEKALAASERALTLTPWMLWIATNRAHALLFLGRPQEAIEAYTRHKGETVLGGSKWEAAILGDFAEFRKRGLGDPGFARVEKALAAAPQSPDASVGNAADVDALNGQVARLYGQGKYKEAAVVAEKALSVAERVLGKEHPSTYKSPQQSSRTVSGPGPLRRGRAALRARP